MSRAEQSRAEQRLDYMDVFRGIGILLMIMGHVGFGEKFDHFIHAFHMPMFFFASGFFYSKRQYSIKEYIYRKARSLLIPYVSFGMAHYLLFIDLNGFSVKPFLHLLTINTEGLPIAGALWFLTALFYTDILYFVLDKWNAKWVIVPCTFAGTIADRILPYPLPWALSAAFVGLGLYWLGEMSRKHEEELKKAYTMSWIQIVIIGSVATALIFINSYVNMREGRYGFLPLFWINALLSICLWISISKLICKMNRIDWLTSIGRNSIVYVCLNQLVIRVICKIFSYITMPKILLKVLVFIVSTVVLSFLSELATKTRWKILFGR